MSDRKITGRTKPVDFGQLVKVVKGIDEFWFTVVRLPGRR